MTAPWTSGPASDEYFRQLADFNAKRDSFMQGLQQSLHQASGQPQPQPQVNTVPQAVSQQPDPALWNDPDLMGAAHFWGIPADVAAHMPKHVLQAQIEMLRQGARPDEDTFTNRMAAMLSVPAMLAIGGAEAISGLAQSLPIIGPAARRNQAVRSVDTYIRSLEEGIRTSTPENFQPVLSGVNVAGNIAATWYPAAGAFGVASRGTAWATSPLVRASLRGAGAAAGELAPATASAAGRMLAGRIVQGGIAGVGAAGLLEGGGEHPGMAMAVGGPLGAAGAALAPAIDALATKVSKRFLSPAMFEAATEATRPLDRRTGPIGDLTNVAQAAANGDESAIAMMEELQRTGRMAPTPQPYLQNWNESTMGPKPSRDQAQAWQDRAVETLMPHRPAGLDVNSADALATQMNKVNTIVSSPELPRVAMQTAADDISVAESAMVSNPGGTNVIDGIADPAQFIQTPTAPYMAFAQRQGRLSALLSDRPITPGMISEYERHGVYSGQTVLNERGIPHEIAGISENGVATLHNPNTGAQITRSVGKLAPMTENPGAMEVPGLWDQFQQFADHQTVQTQLAMGGAMTPAQFETVRTANMPQYISDFLDLAGVQAQGDRARITQSFNREWVKSFAAYAPPEAAFNQQMQAHLGEVVNLHPPTPVGELDQLADSKGFIAIPNGEGGWGLRNIAPGLSGEVVPMEMSFDSVESAQTWLKKTNRELPDISPDMPIPGEVAGGLFREPQQLPNSNEASVKALQQSIADLGEENGGVPVVPPHELAAAQGDWGKMKNLWNRASAFTPMRPRFAKLSQAVRDIAGDDFGLAQDYDQLTNTLVSHHNNMHEPVNNLADLLAPIDTKRMINGEWMRTWQIADEGQRLATAQRLGWKPAEIEAMDKFSQLISNVAQEDVNPELRKYIGGVATKQSIPELFNSAWSEPTWSQAIHAWQEHASTTNINMRELDPRVFGEGFIRSVFWKRDMAPVFDPVMEKWKGYAETEGVDRVAGFMKNWMNVMKQGYTADDDLALDLVHASAQKVMGDSFTRQQAKELVNFGMNTSHAAYLGYRVHVMARDALQLFFAIPRAGTDLASVITKYTTNPEYRQMVWDTALNEGAIQLTMPHRVSPGALGGELEQASVGMAPENMSKRMRLLGAVKAEVRDWVPDVLKGSSESIFKPLYLYGKQQELMRALVYRSGFEKAERALAEFRDAGFAGDLNKLMGESGARTYDPAWQEEFKRIVASGDDKKAAGFLGRQLADATQFKYGASENPTIGRSITGKLFMQFGSFQTQYIQYLRESLQNDFVHNGVKTLLTAGAVTTGLEAAQHETGWNFRLMNPYAIGFAGGPAISMGMGLAQGVGAVGRAILDPDAPAVDRGLAAGGQALGAMASGLNPVAGLYNTVAGVGSALNDSPLPGHALGRLAITGERGALPDILATVHSVDLQPAPNIMRQGAWQLPQVPQMQPVYPAAVPNVGSPNLSGIQNTPREIPNPGAPYSYRPGPDASQPIGTRSVDMVKAALASQNFAGFAADEAQFLQQLHGVPLDAAVELYRGFARDRAARTGPPNEVDPYGSTQPPYGGGGAMF